MRVLCIDGGGIRGIIPALVLAELEERTGRRTAEMFDLIAGTSTGGILAAALVRPGDDGAAPRYSARDLLGLYEAEGPEIFDRPLLKRIRSVDGWLDERYDDAGLVAALRRYLDGARLSDALADVLITAYEIEGRFAFFFRSARARADRAYDFALADACRATAAAPTYFEPARVTDLAGDRPYALIDGGVYAANPALCALADVAADGDTSGVDLLLALGTGSHTRPLPYAQVRGWGQLEWARSIVDVVFDGQADTTDFAVGRLLPGDRYVRLQVELDHASDALDDASPRNMAALRAEGTRLLREQAATVDALAERLAAAEG
ncbi:MAG TPA: patatin-like phospholipase family protein [Solirubrobacteraceae bacterium]|nr:patatin-like phospholipase family protein [Solirubrobacteraceae bacterium]